MNIGTLTATLGIDATGLSAGNAAMQKFEATTTASIQRISQRFRTFGYLASAAVTLPLMMAGKATFNLAKEYEFSIQKIVGLTGVAQSEVNKWSDEILKMGPRLGKMPQELDRAGGFASRLTKPS